MVKLMITTADKIFKSKPMMQLQNPFSADFPCTVFKLTLSCKNLPVKKTKRNKKSCCPWSQQSSTLQDHL